MVSWLPLGQCPALTASGQQRGARSGQALDQCPLVSHHPLCAPLQDHLPPLLCVAHGADLPGGRRAAQDQVRLVFGVFWVRINPPRTCLHNARSARRATPPTSACRIAGSVWSACAPWLRSCSWTRWVPWRQPLGGKPAQRAGHCWQLAWQRGATCAPALHQQAGSERPMLCLIPCSLPAARVSLQANTYLYFSEGLQRPARDRLAGAAEPASCPWPGSANWLCCTLCKLDGQPNTDPFPRLPAPSCPDYVEGLSSTMASRTRTTVAGAILAAVSDMVLMLVIGACAALHCAGRHAPHLSNKLRLVLVICGCVHPSSRRCAAGPRLSGSLTPSALQVGTLRRMLPPPPAARATVGLGGGPEREHCCSTGQRQHALLAAHSFPCLSWPDLTHCSRRVSQYVPLLLQLTRLKQAPGCRSRAAEMNVAAWTVRHPGTRQTPQTQEPHSVSVCLVPTFFLNPPAT